MNKSINFKKKLLATFVASAAMTGFSSVAIAQADDSAEEIIVTGIKASLERSIDIKRNSNQIVEAITADDVGKMPDQNVAESLQRIPGVQIDRRDGEGTKVRIRGLDQNLTLMNGNSFTSGMEYFQIGEAKTEYQDSLEGVPSELLGGLEVYKSPKASVPEGGIGGVVNLKTRSPLDLKETLLAANLKMDQGANSADAKPSGFVVFGDRWDNFAAIGSITSSQKTVNTASYDAVTRGVRMINMPVSGDAYVAPALAYVTDSTMERERLGGSLSLAWEVSDTLKLGFDWFHSDLKIENAAYTVKHTLRDNNDNLNTAAEENASTLMNVGKPFKILTSTKVTMGEGEMNSAGENFEAKADNFALNFVSTPSDKIKFSGDVSYSKGESDLRSGYIDTRFDEYRVTRHVGTTPATGTPNGWGDDVPNPAAPADSTFSYDARSGGMPKLGFTNPGELSNASGLLFKSLWALGSTTETEDLGVRGDVELTVDSKRLKTLKFGFRHADKSAEFDELRYLSDFSKTAGAMSPNLYNADGSLKTATTFDPNTAPLASNLGAGVREAVFYDLCGNGGIPAGKMCDIDGDGKDDNQPYGPNGYFIDAAIGLKAWDLTTSKGTSMAVALYGPKVDDAAVGDGYVGRWSNSPGYLPWQTYTGAPARTVKLTDFFAGGNYNTNTLLIENAKAIASNPEAWRAARTPSTPGAWFSVPFESWKVDQLTDAFYIESDFEGDVIPYTLNVGLRAVNTRVSITKATVDNPAATTWSIATDGWNSQGVLLQSAQTTATKSYWDVLPSLNYTLNIDDSNKLRISAAKVIARPSFQDLGKGFSKNFTRNDSNPVTFYQFIGGSDGNPGLDPYRATQADVAYEWYFGDLGLLSAGLFYKSVDSFIAGGSVNVTENDGNPQGDGFSTAPVTKPINGDGGVVNGFEFQIQESWDNGFGAAFNYTYSASETSTSTTSDAVIGLPGVSKNSYNLMGFYENEMFSARLAYSWRSEYVSPNRSVFGVANSTYTLTEKFEAYGQWDAQLGYNFSENLSFTLEGLNLGGEAQSAYMGWKELPSQYVNQERRVVLGATFKM